MGEKEREKVGGCGSRLIPPCKKESERARERERFKGVAQRGDVWRDGQEGRKQMSCSLERSTGWEEEVEEEEQKRWWIKQEMTDVQMEDAADQRIREERGRVKFGGWVMGGYKSRHSSPHHSRFTQFTCVPAHNVL